MDQTLHQQELEIEKELHLEEQRNEMKAHLLDILADLERHFQQLNADLIGSTREAERDMFDQRSQQLQTLTIAATVMLTALISVLIQGVLMYPANEFIYICYALSNATSLALLVICIVLCTEIISKASSYMYLRSIIYNKSLREAVDETRKLLSGRITPLAGRSNEEIESKWKQHENVIAQFMSHRDAMHKKLTDLLSGSTTNGITGEMDFATYWDSKWKDRAGVAITSFYCGTLLMITANVLYMWELWLNKYNSRQGATFAVVILLFSGLLSAVIFALFRFYKHVRNFVRSVFGVELADDEGMNYSMENNGVTAARHRERRNIDRDYRDTPRGHEESKQTIAEEKDAGPSVERYDDITLEYDYMDPDTRWTPSAFRNMNILRSRVNHVGSGEQNNLREPLYMDNPMSRTIPNRSPLLSLSSPIDGNYQSATSREMNNMDLYTPLSVKGPIPSAAVVNGNSQERRRYRAPTAYQVENDNGDRGWSSPRGYWNKKHKS